MVIVGDFLSLFPVFLSWCRCSIFFFAISFSFPSTFLILLNKICVQSWLKRQKKHQIITNMQPMTKTQAKSNKTKNKQNVINATKSDHKTNNIRIGTVGLNGLNLWNVTQGLTSCFLMFEAFTLYKTKAKAKLFCSGVWGQCKPLLKNIVSLLNSCSCSVQLNTFGF